MNTTLASILLGVFILLQVAWFIWPRQGSNPLSPQAEAAAEQMSGQHIPESRALFEAEWRHDSERRDHQHIMVFVLWLVADVAVFPIWRAAVSRKT